MELLFASILILDIYNGTAYVLVFSADASRWSTWWKYRGISGPTMWGNMNNEWYMCNKGRNQSPIDIDPNILLFDPSLKHISIEDYEVNGWHSRP